jgi:hypothetical protein
METIDKIGVNGRVYKVNDLTGLTVGSYTVMYRSETKIRSSSNRAIVWTSKCECGNIRELEYSNIMTAKKRIENGDVFVFSCGCKSSLPFGVSASKKVYRQYKVHSATRGYCFDLTFEEFLSITKQDCHYCGTPPKNKLGNVGKASRGNGYYVYSGIDRMKNNIGYVLDNIVPCCKRCNRAKDVMGTEEFLEWIAKVYEHSVVSQFGFCDFLRKFLFKVGKYSFLATFIITINGCFSTKQKAKFDNLYKWNTNPKPSNVTKEIMDSMHSNYDTGNVNYFKSRFNDSLR